MFTKRTDLAIEAHELWQESAGKTTRLAGVKATEKKIQGYPVTQVDILDREGEAALGKPAGSYRTLDLTAFWQRGDGFFDRAVRAVGQQVKELTPDSRSGAGGGPWKPGHDAGRRRPAGGGQHPHHPPSHRRYAPALFRVPPGGGPAAGGVGDHRRGNRRGDAGTGGPVHPSVVIAVDALASRRVGRVCCTVQFSDTGIIPGSGVGNHRSALNRETLGVPVLAVGVPTVVDAATLAADLLEESGLPEPDLETLRSRPENLMVTPRDIDQQVRDLGKVIGYGINWALQDLEVDEINTLLS